MLTYKLVLQYVTCVYLLESIWEVTPVTNETELSPIVERENVQPILKITGKDEKRNKGLTKGRVL